jgi:hypothetical protein
MFMIITEMAHRVKDKRSPELWTSGVSWPFLAAADASEGTFDDHEKPRERRG